MLKGERPEPYLTPSRERRLVCQLCASRAQKEGWIRESASAETPVQPPRPSERKGFFRRRRRLVTADGDLTPAGSPDRLGADAADEKPEPARAVAVGERRPPRMRDPRHVRAVPTNAQLKIERAVDLFNESEHRRTVAGIAKTLGTPHVSACTSSVSAAKVLLTVAWELSWYQFAVDLSDSREPVRLHDRGHEIEELPGKVKRWNARAEEDGRIAVDAVESLNGEAPEQSL
jgi:hypothetical protein